MGVLVEVINSTGIEAARPALDTVNLVALLQQQLRKVATVLTGYSCYESFLLFCHKFSSTLKSSRSIVKDVRQCTACIKNQANSFEQN